MFRRRGKTVAEIQAELDKDYIDSDDDDLPPVEIDQLEEEEEEEDDREETEEIVYHDVEVCTLLFYRVRYLRWQIPVPMYRRLNSKL
jgi:hypothetical protein